MICLSAVSHLCYLSERPVGLLGGGEDPPHYMLCIDPNASCLQVVCYIDSCLHAEYLNFERKQVASLVGRGLHI